MNDREGAAIDTAALAAELTRNPSRGMVAAEAAALLAMAERPLLLDKLLILHFGGSGQHDIAVDLARSVLSREPTSENAKNALLVLTAARRFDEAFATAAAVRELLEPTLYNDLMCSLCAASGDVSRARRFGTETLRLKDAAAASLPARTFRRAAFDPARPSRNVIALSLFGDDPRYLMGARNNAVAGRYLYPGWATRFYVDDSVPLAAQRALRAEGAQVLKVEGMEARTYGTFWRFLVEDDPDVDLYLIRDADSVVNIRERAAVEAWLASNTAFHVMRDHIKHSELILAGMWGAHRGNIGDMQQRVRRFVQARPKRLNDKTVDQVFLRREIWPIVRQSVLCHDAHFSFGEVSPWPEEFRLPPGRHVGQNDWIHYRKTNDAR